MNNNFKFISSKNNELIIETAKLKEKKYRDKYGLFCAEGIKLLGEVLHSQYEIERIIATEERAGDILANPQIKLRRNAAQNNFIIITTNDVYKKISSEESFEGVMCIVKKPPEDSELSYKLPIVILDSVQDAGNVGTIIRTANALCKSEFIISGNCADIYNPKTLRAAMGANFYQKIKYCTNSENFKLEIAKLRKNGYNILATHLSKTAKSVKDVKFTSKTAVIFGNEGRGISDDIADICDEKIIIPVKENSESLNVSIAASIILWEINKTVEDVNYDENGVENYD